jgi:hypothetical protein
LSEKRSSPPGKIQVGAKTSDLLVRQSVGAFA